MLSLPLFTDENTMGALDLYSKQPDQFSPRDVVVGTVFVAHAAVALKASLEQANLRAAVDSRELIGRAKGILMTSMLVTEDQAFALLREASQRLNIKLRDIAQTVSDTGEIP